MLAEERFHEIIKLVERQHSVSVQELTEILNTSESTIRRDLTTLDRRGVLKKVHGGATEVNMGYATKDETVAVRQDLNTDEKVKIAKYAASLIKSDDFVYIDAGTTTEILIDNITEQDALYVTNGIFHARKLAQKGCKVYLTGGELKDATLALVGATTIAEVQKYHFTKGFFGANGIHKEWGITTPDVSEAMVKEMAANQCRERFVLADSSKFGQISAVSFVEPKKVTVLTTDLQDKTFLSNYKIVEVQK